MIEDAVNNDLRARNPWRPWYSFVRRSAVWAADAIYGDEVARVPWMIDDLVWLIEFDPAVRRSAIHVLSRAGSSAAWAMPALLEVAETDEENRELAIEALRKIGPHAAQAAKRAIKEIEGPALTE